MKSTKKAATKKKEKKKMKQRAMTIEIFFSLVLYSVFC